MPMKWNGSNTILFLTRFKIERLFERIQGFTCPGPGRICAMPSSHHKKKDSHTSESQRNSTMNSPKSK